MFAVFRSAAASSEQETPGDDDRQTFLTRISYFVMTSELLKQMVPEASVRLSKQEREVIWWTAEGKTTAEISVIMGLSVRTVTFHIGNVVKKLNASNKTAAAVRAAVLGLLRTPTAPDQISGDERQSQYDGAEQD